MYIYILYIYNLKSIVNIRSGFSSSIADGRCLKNGAQKSKNHLQCPFSAKHLHWAAPYSRPDINLHCKTQTVNIE